ncbi:MAG: glutamate--cysteine ligase [Clostridia bacterium]|nr:glutamate--cysteine ligase [Deltaproteobacteria bacterium]
MSRDFEGDSPRIRSAEDVVEVFSSGEKPAGDFRIGAEYEKLPFFLKDGALVPYEGGIEKLINGLEACGWRKTGVPPIVSMERESPSEGDVESFAKAGTKLFNASISLEPGGQFELSGAPQKSMHDVARELAVHLKEVVEVADNAGIGLATWGFRPFERTDEMVWMPKDRYRIMREHLGPRGRGGLEMMLLSGTVQANLDFASERDMADKMRAAMAVSPVVAAMFANSPFEFGRWGGQRSRRYAMWRDVDRARTGILPFVFENDFGYRDYIEWALDVPLVFLRREGDYIPVGDITFRQYMERGWKDEVANLTDFENHISVLFPEVRLKRFIETRCGDSVPPGLAVAMIALWKGLIYDPEALRDITGLFAGFSMPEREALRIAAAQDALLARGPTFDLGELAIEVLRIADRGLKTAGLKDAKGRDESHWLAPLKPIVTSKRTLADAAVHKYGAGPWNAQQKLQILSDNAYSHHQLNELV